MTTETERAYFAGIIDGEGSISCIKQVTRKPSGKVFTNFRPAMQISNTSKELVDWIRARFGGSLLVFDQKAYKRYYGRKWAKNIKNWKDAYRVYFSKSEVKQILPEVMPYLVIKKQQAFLAMRLYALHETFAKKNPETGRFIFTPFDEEEQQIVVKMRELNKRGVKTR